MAARGIVAVSINYRLQSTEASCRTFGSIEAAGSDAKAAVRWLRAQAGELRVDPARILVHGCSAGGRTALWAALAPGDGLDQSIVNTDQGNANFSSRPTMVAPLSADLYAPRQVPPLSPCPSSPPPQGGDAVVNAASPPMLIIHGTRDTNFFTPYSAAVHLSDIATAAGVPHFLYTIEGGGHCPRFDWELFFSYVVRIIIPLGPHRSRRLSTWTCAPPLFRRPTALSEARASRAREDRQVAAALQWGCCLAC
jgi:acetyl esterase/lipase